MDGIIINELSLSGQFHDSQDFWKNGMPPFYKALQDARSFGVGYLFKQGSFYGAQATPDKTLHDLLTAPEARIIDEAKRYKSTLARAICNPFWHDAPSRNRMRIAWQTKQMYPVVPLPKLPPVWSAFCRLYAPCMRSIRLL